jgi:mono/diheme cytochrome c family protein
VSAPNPFWVEGFPSRVPQRARARKSPLGDDADARLAGKKLFTRHCAECHGESGEGTKRGPRLDAAVNRATEGEIFWLITNGIVQRGMPGWSKLPEPQRWQIIAFLRRLKEQN